MRIVQTNLAFHASANLLYFTEKLKTVSGKYRVNMVKWSFLSFAVKVILYLSNNLQREEKWTNLNTNVKANLGHQKPSNNGLI